MVQFVEAKNGDGMGEPSFPTQTTALAQPVKIELIQKAAGGDELKGPSLPPLPDGRISPTVEDR